MTPARARTGRRPASFGLKVFGYLAATLLLLAIANSLYVLHGQRTMLAEHLREEGFTIAGFLAHAARLGVFAEDPETLGTPVRAALAQSGVVEVLVFDARMHLLRQAPPAEGPPVGPGPERAWREAMTALSREGGTVRREEPDRVHFWAPVLAQPQGDPADTLYFEDPSPSVSRPILGFVSVALSKDRLHAQLRTAIVRGIAMAVGFLVLGGVLTALVIRAVTQPLRDLAAHVRERGGMPEGEGRDADEIGVLADSFGHLIAELDGSFETISRLKGGLEETVAVRTRELAERQSFLEVTNQRLEDALAELRDTQSQLIQSEKMAALGQLVAGVAHEVNNTLNFISGAVPALNRAVRELRGRLAGSAASEGAGEEVAELLADVDLLLGNIDEGARRAGRIVRDLRDFSRSGGADGAGEMSTEPVDLHRGLDSTLALLAHECRDRIRVERRYAEDLPVVRGDPGQLNQVFMNLLLNAIQAIPERGEIRVETRREDGRVCVCVADSGVGIDPELVGRIFDPFFTTKEVGRGTGLGLAVAYRIVAAHGGELGVTSRPGEGTEFRVALPAGGDEEAAA